MPLTNAERQARYRERQKERLAAAGKSLPVLIRDHIKRTWPREERHHAPLIAAEAVQAVLNEVGALSAEDSPASAALVDMLGGTDYLHAIDAWKTAAAIEAKRRKNRKPVEPPKIPVT